MTLLLCVISRFGLTKQGTSHPISPSGCSALVTSPQALVKSVINNRITRESEHLINKRITGSLISSEITMKAKAIKRRCR